LNRSYPFWVVEKGDCLWNIAKKVYGLSSDRLIANKVNELKLKNPQIKNPDLIHPNQVLLLPDTSYPQMDAVPASELAEMEREFCSMDNETRKLVLGQNDELQFLVDFKNASLPSFISYDPGRLKSDMGGKAQVKNQSFEMAAASTVLYKSVKSGMKTTQLAAKGKFGNLLSVSPHTFSKLEGEVIRGAKENVRYIRMKNDALRMVPTQSRVVDLGGKILVVPRADGSGIRGFSAQVNAYKQMAKHLTLASQVFKVIDLGVSVSNVADAWGTKEQNRTIGREAGKIAGGIAGGSLAGALLVATGPAGLVVGFTVFLVVPWVASEFVGRGGELTGEHIPRAISESVIKVFESDRSLFLGPKY